MQYQFKDKQFQKMRESWLYNMDFVTLWSLLTRYLPI